jgi:hypothetical protein
LTCEKANRRRKPVQTPDHVNNHFRHRLAGFFLRISLL